jgi:hypothetical protein
MLGSCTSVTLGQLLPPFGVPYTPRSQVDLGRLAGPLEGITLFMVARPRRTPATEEEEEERGSSVVEPLTRGTANHTISDRSATPHHRAGPPSPTPDTTNLNPNGLGSDSSLRISPLGNRVHSLGDLVTHLNPNPTGRRPPGRRHRFVSFKLDGVASLIPPLGTV